MVRSRLLRWLAEQQLHPRIIGEFDDSALMQAFGQSGSGIFVAPSVIAEEVCRQYGVELIGQTEAVNESFYAISVERKVTHPGIVAITEGRAGICFIGDPRCGKYGLVSRKCSSWLYAKRPERPSSDQAGKALC